VLRKRAAADPPVAECAREPVRPSYVFPRGRKQIVNLKWIEKVDVGIGGGLSVTLRGGRTVEMSRRQSARLRGILSL